MKKIQDFFKNHEINLCFVQVLLRFLEILFCFLI